MKKSRYIQRASFDAAIIDNLLAVTPGINEHMTLQQVRRRLEERMRGEISLFKPIHAEDDGISIFHMMLRADFDRHLEAEVKYGCRKITLGEAILRLKYDSRKRDDLSDHLQNAQGIWIDESMPYGPGYYRIDYKNGALHKVTLPECVSLYPKDRAIVISEAMGPVYLDLTGHYRERYGIDGHPEGLVPRFYIDGNAQSIPLAVLTLIKDPDTMHTTLTEELRNEMEKNERIRATIRRRPDSTLIGILTSPVDYVRARRRARKLESINNSQDFKS